MQHVLLTKIFGGLYKAPLDPTKLCKVLDVGCGTGVWSIDFARQHPDVEVIGLDFNESPNWASAPPNCHFKVADFDHDATWRGLENQFDLVYSRLLVAGVRDWPRLVQRYQDCLKPGGWVENHEMLLPIRTRDGKTADGSALQVFGSLGPEALLKLGLDGGVAERLPAMERKAGFQRVGDESYKMFIGPWSDAEEERELGKMGAVNMKGVVRGFRPVMVKVLGWSEERAQSFFSELEREIGECSNCFYLPFKVVYGQNPEYI